MKNSLRIGVAAGMILLAAVCGYAHAAGISRGEYRLDGSHVNITLVFARQELIGAIPQLDANRDGALSETELRSNSAPVESTIVRNLDIRIGDAPCSGKLRNVSLTEEDGVAIQLTYTCSTSTKAAPSESLKLDLRFLTSLTHGHRHLANVITEAANTNLVAYSGNSRFEINSSIPSPAAHGWTNAIWPMFRMGVQHILTGYDHLVFLFGLILVGGRVRSILLVITAFTVAHSITLGMAALQVVAPKPHLVEPAIALSIAYVGIENWFVQNASRRWMITFPFGLVHGFGFAGALQQIALPHAQIPVALISFNLGVEAGQLSVLALILPLILWMHRRKWFAIGGVRALSTVIAVAGVLWFFARVLSR